MFLVHALPWSLARRKRSSYPQDGRQIAQNLCYTGASIAVTARGLGDTQVRSFEDYATSGYEFVLDLDLKTKIKNWQKKQRNFWMHLFVLRV